MSNPIGLVNVMSLTGCSDPCSLEDFLRIVSPIALDTDEEHEDLCRLTQSNGIGIESEYINGLVLDCSISSALALEILQSCTKPLIGNFSVLNYDDENHMYCGIL